MPKLTKTVQKRIEIEYSLFNENKDLPLVIYLHGFGELHERLTTGKKQKIPFLAWVNKNHKKDFSYLVPYLDSLEKWNPLKIKTLVDYMVEERGFDKNKIVLIGNSWGARGCWDIACEYPNMFSAVISISGVSCWLLGKKLKKVPTLIIHGGDDKVVPCHHAYDMHEAIGGSSYIHRIFVFRGLEHSVLNHVLPSPHVWAWIKEMLERNNNA